MSVLTLCSGKATGTENRFRPVFSGMLAHILRPSLAQNTSAICLNHALPTEVIYAGTLSERIASGSM